MDKKDSRIPIGSGVQWFDIGEFFILQWQIDPRWDDIKYCIIHDKFEAFAYKEELEYKYKFEFGYKNFRVEILQFRGINGN